MVVSFSPLLFLFLHDLRHEFAHLFGGTFLHLPRDVGIGSQREARVEVTEHTRYRFYVHAILECQRCECVSQVVKSQMFQSCIFQNLLVDVDHRIGVVHFACFRGRKHPRVTIEILYKNKMSFLRCLLCACRFHPAARQSAALFLLDFLFVCFIMVLCILRR